jgi:hypothetical protein
MKYLTRTVIVLALVAMITGVISYRLSDDRAVSEALARRDALTWLRTDFQLNDAQFAAIRKLHESYSVVCEDHCRAIQEAARDRRTLQSNPATDPAVLAGAEKRVQELRLICETAIAAHVRQVAAEMAPEHGARYLAMVLPKIADFDHHAAPDLGLNPHRH